MFKNYVKIAWKVLWRNKFFTFVSLFGISLTLMTVIILIVLIDSKVGNSNVDPYRSRSVYVDKIELLSPDRWHPYTPSYYFLDKYIRPLKTPEMVSIHAAMMISFFEKEKKYTADMNYTDGNYWRLMNYNFEEGNAYKDEEVAHAAPVVVINEKMKRDIWGGQACVGKYIEILDVKHRIIGVVENTSTDYMIWLPLTHDVRDLRNVKYDGNYAATLLAKNEGDIDNIKAELQAVASRAEMIDPARYSKVRIIADTSMEKFARSIGPGKELVMSIIVSFMILFMLIPAVNLVNVNISRILDRASEIGIRKAFGASSKRLILQFVVENIMITLFGGLISLVMAGIMLQLLKGMNFVPVTASLINWRVFLLSIVTTLFFALLSGVYPAYKMSRMNVVDALKN